MLLNERLLNILEASIKTYAHNALKRTNIVCNGMNGMMGMHGRTCEKGKIAAHSAYDMFSWYKCLVVSLFVFSCLLPRFLEWESFSDCAFS